MTDDLPPSALRVQRALNQLGSTSRIVSMPATTRTAQDAATAIGCTVGQIAKSILFRGATSARPILVVASGVNRVNERLIADAVGEPVEKASADFVREATSFAIGGIPPVAFPKPIATLVDADLLQYSEVWAAAGTPNAVFNIDPAALVRLTGGTVVRVV